MKMRIFFFFFNLVEKISYAKVARKDLRYFLKRFRPKVAIIEKSKNVDALIVGGLVGYLQTYGMTLLSSKRSKRSTLKTYSKEKVEFKYENETILT